MKNKENKQANNFLLFLALIASGLLMLFLILTVKSRVGVPRTGFATSLAVQKTGKVNVLFDSVKLVLKEGEIKEVVGKINTGGSKVSAVDLNLTFNPKIINVQSINAGTFFKESFVFNNNIDNKTGIARFVVGSREPADGKGDLVLIKILGMQKGETVLQFTEESKAAAQGYSQNILKEVGRMLIQVK